MGVVVPPMDEIFIQCLFRIFVLKEIPQRFLEFDPGLGLVRGLMAEPMRIVAQTRKWTDDGQTGQHGDPVL